MIARAVLAFGEAGNFPAVIKATAEYFPNKERSLAGHPMGRRCAAFKIAPGYFLWPAVSGDHLLMTKKSNQWA